VYRRPPPLVKLLDHLPTHPMTDPFDAGAFGADKAQSLGHLLLRAARLYNEAALRALRADPAFAGVRLAHTQLLPHLDLDGTRPSVLARRMGMSKQAAGELVADLEAMGLLCRAPDPADGRATLVRFTPDGLAALRRGLAALGGVEAGLTAALGAARITGLRGDLAAVAGALEAPADGEGAPG
jgi:DNA-binding MarR family transcriptional regulator